MDASRICPLFYYSSIDLDVAGDLILKVGKKLYLNAAKTIYLESADGTTFDFYIAGVKNGEISANGFRAV